MDSILDAIQEGRLFELPENDKNDSLQFLSHIIEAIPSVPTGTDVVGLVMAREKSIASALGKSFACPHARVPYDEDLICAIGWSPKGIEYNAPDNLPVHIIIMYLIPDNQRNHYLREISILAKALQSANNMDVIRSATELNTVRDYLLDLVNKSKSIAGSETRAKMIQLEARSAITEQKVQQLSNIIVEPLTIVAGLNQKPVILSQNKELVDLLDNMLLDQTLKKVSSDQFIDSVSLKGIFEYNGWRIIKRHSCDYEANRFLLECYAIKVIA